jgi:hypothetical protein
MITAAISTLLGMLGGVLPDFVKLLTNRQQNAHELEFLRLQSELQLAAAKVNADARMREVESNAFVAEAQAFRQQLAAIVEAQARPTGIVWIDGFNAVLRPACTTLIIALFMVIAVPFCWTVISQMYQAAITPMEAAKVIFGSLVGESIMATLGFLYGYRSAAKKS